MLWCIVVCIVSFSSDTVGVTIFATKVIVTTDNYISVMTVFSIHCHDGRCCVHCCRYAFTVSLAWSTKMLGGGRVGW